MAKKLRDYLMGGELKERNLLIQYNGPQETIYEVEKIEPMGLGGQRPSISLCGIVMGSGEIYMKNLALCLKHEEYSQTSPKCTKMTKEEEIKEALDRR